MMSEVCYLYPKPNNLLRQVVAPKIYLIMPEEMLVQDHKQIRVAIGESPTLACFKSNLVLLV